MPHLACLGIPYPKESQRLYCGASRSSVYDAVSEQDQHEDLGSLSAGAENGRKGVESDEAEEGLGGVDSKSEDEKRKFQEFVLCPNWSRDWVGGGQEGGLEALQAKLEDAAAKVKATTTATSNKNKFKVPDEIRKMATETATCRNPAQRKLRKRARKARKKFDARAGAFPRSKNCAETCCGETLGRRTSQ